MSLRSLCLSLVAMWVPTLAWADPARCDAVFLGPHPDCSLSGEWAVSAMAKSEEKGRKLALARLVATVQAGAELHAAEVAGTMAALPAEENVRRCASVVKEAASVSCLVDPSLRESQLCFADLPSEACYDGPPLDLTGVAWKVSEKGRKQLCDAVRDRLIEKEEAASTVQACRIECSRRSTVRCVAR
jgi:hypothetical protein